MVDVFFTTDTERIRRIQWHRPIQKMQRKWRQLKRTRCELTNQNDSNEKKDARKHSKPNETDEKFAANRKGNLYLKYN